MRFAIYIPDNLEGPAPVLYHLSGMSCSEQTFIQKTGYQRWASHYGIIVVSPDVCPSKDSYLICKMIKLLLQILYCIFRGYLWC